MSVAAIVPIVYSVDLVRLDWIAAGSLTIVGMNCCLGVSFTDVKTFVDVAVARRH